MRLAPLFIASILLLGCGSKKQKALSPETEITVENASQVVAFDNTPESVVMFFYSSMIRKDPAWEKVCPSEQNQTKMFRGKIEKYNSWTFTKYRFVKKEEFEKDKWYVTIYMAITVAGDSDEGQDQVTVEMKGGKYLVTDVPS